MARIQKLLLRTGVYASPQGEVRATPARMRAWVNGFRRMKASGIRIPVAWGHQAEAVPCDDSDRASKQYYLSKLNAGYLDDLDFDDATGRMEFSGDIPGSELDARGNLVTWTRLPDGREVKCAVGEVSAAIRDWKDGQGKLWPDALIHVALTPLPVVHGQDGFRPAGQRQPGTVQTLSTLFTQFAPRASTGAIYLSLTGLLHELAGTTHEDKQMADAAMKDDPELDEEGEEGEEGMTPPPMPEPAAPAVDPHFSEAVRVLQELGLHLPPDTTPANLVERICVGGHAINKKVDEDEEDEEGEAGAGGDKGVSYSGEPTQEQRPVMMSLSSARTRAERRLLTREQERHKGAQLKKIERLVSRGLSVHKANALREQVTGYQLSLTQDGDLIEQAVDVTLSIWDEALPRRQFKNDYLERNAVVAIRPDSRQADESPDEIKARAERVSTRK